MNLSKSVKVLCAKQDKTQKQLAAYLNITTVWLNKQLKDNNPRYISSMAMFFGVSVSAFIKEGE